MSGNVFISYSSKDRNVANMVCALLEERGQRCWIAPRDILPGTEWGESIIGGIKGTNIFVLIFSSNANKSPQILREVERAVNKGMPIIPFRIEDVVPEGSLEYFMSVPHWLDALSRPVEEHIVQLSEVIEKLTNGAIEPRSYRSTPPRGLKRIDWNNATVRSAVGGIGLAVLLFVAWIAGLAPPESPVGWLGALLAVGAALLTDTGRAMAWAATGKGRAVLAGLLLLAVTAYGWTYSQYVIPGSQGAPVVRGTLCSPDAQLVYPAECPNLPSDALADAAYDAAALWTAASIGRMKLILGAAWGMIGAIGGALIAGWLGAPRRIRQDS